VSLRTKAITALIVDDEPPARRLLNNLLTKDPNIRVIGEARDGNEAVLAIREGKPDLVFLDIRMPEKDGFRVLRDIGLDNLPYVIFVTAYDEYAVKAFEYHALDYLVKPFSTDRFGSAIEHARQHILERTVRSQSPRLRQLFEHWQYTDASERANNGSNQFLQRLLYKQGDRVTTIEVDAIEWIESADHYVEVHSGGKAYLFHDSLSSLEKKLDPDQFLRIHRTSLVNVNAVEEVKTAKFGTCILRLSSGQELKVARGRREQLDKVLVR
jgi:two-component system LytT family response regulator